MAQLSGVQQSSVESLSRTAEKLIILLDYSNGLLTRVYNNVKYQKGPCLKELSDKVIEHLSKEKEDPTLNVSKVIGAEIITQKAETIENETRFCYETMSDILLFSNEVEPLFGTLVKNILILDIHRNSDLTTRFLGVFFNYVRIYFLASRISMARVACYCHMLAFKEHTRKDPEDAHLVKKFLFENIEPLKVLQQRLSSIPRVCDAICDAIQCLSLTFNTWTSYEALKQGQYFSLSQQDPKIFSHPIEEKDLELYQDATHLDSVGTWIIFLYLIFPEKLNEDIASDQLQAAFNDRNVVILFRDEILDATNEYNNLSKTSRPETKIPKKAINKIISNTKLEDVCYRHRQMRELLRREIPGLIDLTNALPGVIPVKLPLYMACLAIARYEIIWVYAHLSNRDSNTKIKDQWLAAPYLPELMFYGMRLMDLIINNTNLIHRYYKDQLTLDLQQLIPFVQSMRKAGKLDIQILDHVDLIIQQITEAQNEKGNLSSKSLEGLRLSWYRVSADLSKEPSILNKPEGQALTKLLNPLIEHTRYFDRLDKEVDARGSMAILWFYRPQLADIFNIYCLGKRPESVKEQQALEIDNEVALRQGRYWIAFIQVFSQALYNVHRQCPEELDDIGIQSLNKAESYINGATSRIEICLRNVLGQLSRWNAQIQPETVAEHLIANHGEKKGWKQLPGFESFYANSQILDKLKYNLDMIGDMCASFAEVDNIFIYNQRLFPSAYLYQTMYDVFYQELRLLVQENQRTMVRPTRFLSRLERLFQAISRVGSYVNLDLEHMIKQILFNDFCDDSVGGVGSPIGIAKYINPSANIIATAGSNNGPVNSKLVHDIRDWYIGIVDSRCSAPLSGCVYSPILNGFYDLKPSPNPAEDYASMQELETLCQIIGPSGVRLIDYEMNKIAHSAIGKISTVIKKNRDLIAGVDMEKFYEEERWKSITSRFVGLDIISRSGVTLGSVMIFRKLLRDALYVAMKNRQPFYCDTVKCVAEKLTYDNNQIGVGLNGYDSLCDISLDCGILTTSTDRVMMNLFRQIINEDESAWQFLPLIFGICFSDQFWNSAKYNMKLGALSNNGFALAHTVNILIECLKQKNSHRYMKLLFLDIAGRTLLFLKKASNNQSINHMFLFLDYFIEVAHDLKPNDLQNCSVPYDVIRAQLVKTYGDASGFYTETQLQSQPDDEVKDNEEN